MNPTEALRQLQSLFLPRTGFIEVRAFTRLVDQGDRLEGGQQWWLDTSNIEAEFAKLPDLMAIPNGEVYVGANPRSSQDGSKESVKVMTACYTDLDKVDDVEGTFEKVMKRPLPPNFVVRSGGGLHLYWLIKPTELKDAWTAGQRGILEAFRLMGADRTVAGDESRVLRLVPYPNRKKGLIRPTSILQNNSQGRYTLDQIMAAYPYHEIQTRNLEMAKNADQFIGVLGYKTLGFIRHGAADGERNKTLFHAACDMAGNGIPADVATSMLIPSAVASGLGVREVETTVKSAYGKPREPVLKVRSVTAIPPSEAAQLPETPRAEPSPPPAIVNMVLPPKPSPMQPPTAMPPLQMPKMDMREELANYKWSFDVQSESRRRVVLGADDILNKVQSKTGEWPRRLADLLFVPGRDGSPRILTTHNQYFAWLMSFFEINWTDSEVTSTNGDERSPVDQGKFYEYCRQNTKHVYDSIAPYPHYPLRADTYYFNYELADDDDASFNEFIARFNPETDLDRKLLIAAMLTCGWGGPPGARPLFALMSTHGPGSGKTATAEAIIQIWQNQPFTISATERNWERARGRFLSDSALQQRCVLIDNVKSILGGNELESLITGANIDGHKLHVGNMSRPNLFTWFVTVNSPTFSPDLCQRAVVIQIGKQKHDEDFKAWSMKFVEERRPYLINSCMKLLRKRTDDVKLDPVLNDRWVGWRNEVLTKIAPDAVTLSAIQKEILTRRGQYNAEIDDAKHIYVELMQLLKENNIDPNTAYCKIQAEVLCRRIMDRVNKDLKSVSGAALFLKRYLSVPPLTVLERDASNRGRCIWYLYKGPMTTLKRPTDQISLYGNIPDDVNLYRN